MARAEFPERPLTDHLRSNEYGRPESQHYTRPEMYARFVGGGQGVARYRAGSCRRGGFLAAQGSSRGGIFSRCAPFPAAYDIVAEDFCRNFMVRSEYAPAPSQTAVFDLDGTLLAGDSTAAWLRTLLLSSGRRFLAAAAVLPVCLLLIYFPFSRRIGASTLLWIATFGYDQQALADSIESFAGNFEAGRVSLRWREDGLRAMQRHTAAGDRVVVVTAAPALLARRLLAPWSDIAVLGSTLGRWQGGWVEARQCRGREKCRALEASGYGVVWKYAYTDSHDDIPLLAGAEHGFVVNARPAVISRLQAFGLSRVARLRWI